MRSPQSRSQGHCNHASLPASDVPVRAILTFHSIDDRDSVLSCSPHYFSLLLESLAAHDIPLCDLAAVLDPDTRAGVAITFDDGMRSVLQHALPVLREHAAPAHVFVATGAIESTAGWPRGEAGIPAYEMLNWGELEQLQAAGVYIESHTHSHPDMRTLAATQMQDECEQADTLIERRLGRRPCFFAYPFGYHNPQVRDFARGRYQGTVTTELRPLGRDEDLAALPRLDSYYLRSAWRIQHLDSVAVRGWLALRNVLRTLRGSQCTAACR
jgi:peptidoglycan/xylan/chitin deacetylase (PgdA/CDA1 family)